MLSLYKMAGKVNAGIIFTLFFAAAVNGVNIHCNENCVIDQDTLQGFCENTKGSDVENNKLIALAISGWSFFIILSVFVFIVIVREGLVIYEDCRRNRSDEKENDRSPTNSQLAYESLRHDRKEEVNAVNYEPLQIEDENTQDQTKYENVPI